MSFTVEVNLNSAGMREFFSSPTGPMARDIMRRARNVESEAKRRCPVDTGRLRSSIASRLEFQGEVPVGIVGTTVQYAIFQETGSGIYAGGSPIVPVHASVLRWQSKGEVFFRPSVRGVRGKHFLVGSLPAAAR